MLDAHLFERGSDANERHFIFVAEQWQGIDSFAAFVVILAEQKPAPIPRDFGDEIGVFPPALVTEFVVKVNGL